MATNTNYDYYKQTCKSNGTLGTGVSKMRFHNTTKTGYCTTCKSHCCIKTAYIPKYDRVWTWEEQRQRFMMEAR